MSAGMILLLAAVVVPLAVRAVMELENRLPYPVPRANSEKKPLSAHMAD